MSIGSDLLELQRLDLERTRVAHELDNLPALRELSRKRKTYARLKAEATKLFAQRKDIETEIDDLDEERAGAEAAVSEAQARSIDPSDYRQVQDFEEELSLLAKQIERVEFKRAAAAERLKASKEKEGQLDAYIKRFEQSIVSDTRAAREHAENLQTAIADVDRQRERILRDLAPADRNRYERASERFSGLAVEALQGRVPSVCRTTLTEAAVSSLRREGEVGECPYCHRIIVVQEA